MPGALPEDALDLTVSTLTTTGYGDIALQGAIGRLLKRIERPTG